MPRPRFVSCPLCGRGFGSASIGIHVPQCYDKALQRWKLDPTSGPRPVMPACMSAAYANNSVRSDSVGGKSGSQTARRSVGGSGDGSSESWRVCGAGTTAVRGIRQRSEAGASSYNSSGTAKSGGGSLVHMMLDEQPPDTLNLHPCSKCGRKFNFDRIRYHESVCKGDSKRSVFASAAQRSFVSGDAVYENTSYAIGGGGGGKTRRGRRGDGGVSQAAASRQGRSTSTSRSSVGNYGGAALAPRPSTWRQQHEEFISAIRSARVAGAQAKSMWGVSGGGGRAAVPRASARASKPVAPARVPPSMARQDMLHKMNVATGGRMARATATTSVMAAPGTRTMLAPRASGGGGGGGRSSVGGGGGGGGRILNDNTTSLGMLQAFGRA